MDEHLLKALTGPSQFLFPLFGGITKREYFAAMAMMGLMDPDKAIALNATELADAAVKQADALIERLK